MIDDPILSARTALHGRMLESITFLRGYVQFAFEDAQLSCFVWPDVIRGDARISSGSPTYQGALTNLIGSLVTDFNVDEAQGLQVILSDGSQLRATRNTASPQLELAMLQVSGNPGSWWTW